MDTTTASGRLVFGIFATLAEFECELIRGRTIAGSLRRVAVAATAAVPT
jgi:DNA invertase Pin-like site-specific DNA recombinase